MQATRLYAGDALSVHLYRCSSGPTDRPFAEVHARHSLSYVRRGSFGCRTLGGEHELVAGAVMVGQPGQEYTATHEHHACGDECLSIKMSAQLADTFGKTVWDLARVPPLAGLMVAGELVQAAAEGRSDVGVDEAALMFAERCATVASPGKTIPSEPRKIDKRRAVEAALWLEENAAEPVGLEDVARQAALSSFHFLRNFKSVLGVTPHQYLVRLRLRHAASLLAQGGMSVTEVALEAGFADLSNFVRTFGRAAGVSPARFSKYAGKRASTVDSCLTTSD